MGLDLSRIEAWTRGMLEAEARRRGIRGPEFRTRADLVRLILRHQYGDRLSAGRDRIAQGRQAIARARELVGTAVSAFASVLPEPLDALARLRARLPSSPPAPVVRPRPVGARSVTAAVDSRVRVPAPSPVESSAQHQPTVVSAPPAPAVVEPALARTRTFIEEPIRTRSMARLLAAQGHRERALAIYEELLAQDGSDQALRDELAAVRRGEPITTPTLPEPPSALEHFVLPDAGDRLFCQGQVSTGFLLRWQITEAGIARARAVLSRDGTGRDGTGRDGTGRDGELAVRVICIRPDPDHAVRSEVTEHGPLPASGEWQAPPLPGAARCFAAVGLRRDERFVAIVHTHPATVRAEEAAAVTDSASL